MEKKIGFNHIRSENKDGVPEKDLETIFARLPGEREPYFYMVDPTPLADPYYVPNLELPRCMPENLDLSQSLVLVFETELEEYARVFIYDFADGSLYYVRHTGVRKYQYPFIGFNGYAAFDGKLHFFPGCFACFSDDPSAETLAQSLEVDRLDVRTNGLETAFSKLNDPKPVPTVFVYSNKIYVIAGIDEDAVVDDDAPSDSALFECMDPRELTWTKLPNPPFRRWDFTPHMLDTVKGILLIAGRTTEEEDVEDTFELHQFDFGSKKWSLHSLLPESLQPFDFNHLTKSYDPFPPRPLYLGISATLFAGCTVGEYLFCLDIDGPVLPEIAVYDIFGEGVDHVLDSIIPLSDHLKWFTDHFGLYHGYLNHVAGLTFCLSMYGMTSTKPYLTGVGIMIFELQELQETGHQEKFSFLRSTQCRMFQIPLNVDFTFCKKM